MKDMKDNIYIYTAIIISLSKISKIKWNNFIILFDGITKKDFFKEM